MILLNEKYKNLPTNGEYLYFLQIGEPGERLFKIGTTNNMTRRMKEHERYFHKDITVIWMKKVSSKWTTLKKEEDNKQRWIQNENWEYLRNDRFIIPQIVNTISIKIRKEYTINFDCDCYEI